MPMGNAAESNAPSLFTGTKIMRIAAHATIVTAGVAGLLGSALAADMTGADVKAFLSGKTVYLETTAASAAGQAGQAAIYFAEDGAALFRTPAGTIMRGKWEIQGTANCTAWKERPDASACVRYEKTADSVTVIDAASGQIRARIVKTAPGNAEQLPR